MNTYLTESVCGKKAGPRIQAYDWAMAVALCPVGYVVIGILQREYNIELS